MKKFYPLLFLILLPFLAHTQSTTDAAVALTANLQLSPPQVQLMWPMAPAGADIFLFRREKDSTTWFVLLNQAGTFVNGFQDTNVQPGKTYEYGIQRTVNGVAGFGYASVALEAPLVEDRGKVLVLTDQMLYDSLPNEIDRLHRDLAGDGWDVVSHIVQPGLGVPAVKNIIVTDYNADPQRVKSVILLGSIAVPYSGNSNWDGHPEHAGAWPADTYYGDVDGNWTDVAINNTSPARSQNDNIPNDGKFDQSFVPTPIELSVGRVDFSKISEMTFGATRTQLYKRYLDKDHNWRTKKYVADNRVLIDDNFGYFNGEAFGANGYRNGYALVEPSDVIQADFFDDTDSQSFLMGYGCGGGTYTSAGGVGTSTDFATDSVNIVFSMLFGSYHGDWDYSPNPFMPSALASKGGILTCFWAGRPHFFMQHMGAGETIGYSTIETQNACDNPGYPQYLGACGAHSSLLGDPTLRAHIVAPAADLVVTPQCEEIDVSWTASEDQNVQGYNIYRSSSPYSGFQKLNTNLLAGTNYTDANPPAGMLYYQVRAVKLEETPTAKYWNSSTGAFGEINYTGPTPPDVDAVGGLITCYNDEDTLRGFSSTQGVSFAWTGPGNFSANTQNALASVAGVYTLTVTGPNNCTASATTELAADLTPPLVTASGAAITCTNDAVQLVGNVSGGIPSWEGPNGFLSDELNPTVNQPGVYTLTGLDIFNGCTATATATITIDTVAPANVSAEANGLITCADPSVTVAGTTTTFGVTFMWTGPGGFSSNNQNIQAPNGGLYTLKVTALNGCTATDTATVLTDIVPPDLAATGDTLSCSDPVGTVCASSNTPLVFYQWTGPGGTTNAACTNASIPGVYTVVATAPNGCTSTATAALVQDASLPDASASGGLITCYNETDTLRGESSTPGATFAWFDGQLQSIGTTQNVAVSTAGNYILVVTAPNGCTNSTAVTVIEDLAPPTVSAGVSGSINCIDVSVELMGMVTGGDPFWTGPMGFSAFEPNPIVSLPGVYMLTGLNILNGCTATASVTVEDDSQPPFVEAVGGFLYCENSTVTLSANTNEPGLLIAWPTIPGNEPSPTVDQPGAYPVVVVNPNNGCSSSDTAVVGQIAEFLNVDISPTVINCNGTADILVSAFGGTPPYAILWSNGATTALTTYPYGSAGYGVTVSDAEGCSQSLTGTLPQTDTLSVQLDITDESQPGANDGSITASGLNGSGNYTYNWSISATGSTITDLAPGTYCVTVTDVANGCTQVQCGVVQTTVATHSLPDGWQVQIAPNPTYGQSTLLLNLPAAQPTDVQVTDAGGRLLRILENGKSDRHQFVLDLENQPAGLYFVRLRAGDSALTLRLVKL